MLKAIYALCFMYRCTYLHLGYFRVWFWILNLSQTEQVLTQNSRLFSLLSKRENGKELSRLRSLTCSSVYVPRCCFFWNPA